jgi:hypothetical protein
VGLAELQYTIDILSQQEQRQQLMLGQRQHQPNDNPPPPPPPHTHILPPPPSFNNIQYHQPPSLSHNQFFQPPPLASHLQLAPWPTNYRATSPPKYHGNADPHKFLMCYEVAIASAGGHEAAITKSLIISLKDAAANWYSRLLLRCIYS